jgi:hypothetical protein
MHLIIPPQQQSGYQLRAVVFTGNACGLDTQASIYSTPLFPGSLVMTSFNLMGLHSPISICGSHLAKWYETWEFEFSDAIRTVYVRWSTLYTARLGRNPVEYFGEEIGQSRQLSEDSRVTGKLMPVVALEG